MSEPKEPRKGQELEKFKRRMIRSVARRMKEKKPDNELWEDMRKEIGSNCKKLWERMKVLTLKKLKRLLEAEDRVDLISPVARMTLTDWLLFDLVIVHEKIDVIGREKLTGSFQSKVLMNLFALVQRFEIESRWGENLAEAWTAATVYYNSRGHQCSPMMLQRRWYQAKELTRHKFYKFWFVYRGNQKQLVSAKQDSPDDLQKAIALKYPKIITEKFLNWEERINQRLVILPDELGVKMRQKNLMKPSDTSAPDIVLIEPQIEVIDLGANSDSDETPNEATETNPALVKIKSEPIDHDIDIEYSIPPEKGSEVDAEIERLQMVEETFDDNAVMLETLTDRATPADIEVDNAKVIEDNAINLNDPDVVSFSVVDGLVTNIKRKDDAIILDDSPRKETIVNDKTDTTFNDVTREDSYIDKNGAVEAINRRIETFDNSNESIAQISAVASAGIKVENVNDVIENITTGSLGETYDNLNQTDTVSETFVNSDKTDIVPEIFPVISTVSSAGIKVEKDLIVRKDTGNLDNDVLMSSEIAIGGDSDHAGRDELLETLPVMSRMPNACFKIELDIEPTVISPQVDDPSEIKQKSTEDPVINLEVNEPIDTLMKDMSKKNDLATFGELPADVDFEDCIEFADDGIAYIEDDEEDIISFREPPPTKTEVDEDDLDTDEDDTANKTEAKKFDLKLLMCPVVYTTKLDAMTVFDDISKYDRVYDKLSIDKINALSKPVSKQSITMPEVNETIGTCDDDDLFINEISDCESEVDEVERVNPLSYMLQKPKYRSYNPVLLCKNPDFNTRLKKLSVNFFMSARNRALLQSCIPMTIDMTKAFEDKLVNGTLYLKPTAIDQTISLKDDVEVTSAALVKPSTVQQSCMNIDDTLETELKKRMAERVRAINLPDISQVRRLNQHLLTAEVTPLRPNECFYKQTPELSEKAGPENYVQNIMNDIDNLLLQQKSNDSPDSYNPVAETSSLTVNVPPIEIDVDLRTKVQSSQLSQSSSIVFTHHTINPSRPIVTKPSHTKTPMVSIPTEVKTPRSQPFPPDKAQNKQTANEEANNSANSTVKPKKVNRRAVYPNLAWNRRPFMHDMRNHEAYEDDVLLTIDTLYKMLTALDPTAKPDNRPLKKVNKKTHKDKIKLIENNIEKTIDSFTEQPKNQGSVEVTIDITDDDVEPETKKLPKCKVVRPKPTRYCCWSNFRIDKMKRSLTTRRNHKCDPSFCICCCKEELLYEQNQALLAPAKHCGSEALISETIEHVIKNNSVSNVGVDASIQINLDEVESCKESGPCVTIENSSSVPIEIECGEESGPCVTVESSSSVPIEMETCEEPGPSVATKSSGETIETTSLLLDNTENILFNSTTVDISEVEQVNESTEHPDTSNKTPLPRLRVYSGDNYKPIIPQVISKCITQERTEDSLYNKSSISHCKDKPKKKAPRLPKYLPIDKAPMRKYKVRRKGVEPKPDDIAPCLACMPRISPIAHLGAIEINGVHTCQQHIKTKKRIESKVVLSKKLITDENQPFFVGKGKILLTNMRLPDKDIEVVEQNVPAAAEVEAISLPAGVQIVLLPDQTLTYLVETNVTLTPEESAILPEFLVAIQQQIDKGGITLPALNPALAKVDEVINLDDEPQSQEKTTTTTNVKVTTESTIYESAPAENIVRTAPEKIIENTNGSEMQVDGLTHENMQIKDNCHKAGNVSIEKTDNKKVFSNMDTKTIVTGPDIADVTTGAKMKVTWNSESGAEDNTSKEPVVSVSADDPDNKKCLLYDLMEMSGIMEEDLAPPPLVTTGPQEPILIDTRNFVLHRPVLRDPNVIDVPTFPVSSNVNSYIAVSSDGRFELSAVSSFTELKYACDNNGLFFKLDLDTGNISNINVSIQKFPSKPAIPSAQSDLIDLTDDPDISITTDDLQSIDANPTTVPKIRQQDIPPTSKTQITTILEKKQRLMERLSNNLTQLNILQSKKHVARILKKNQSLLKDRQFMSYSKRKVNKIEAKINLVDSDAPMEEEYIESDDSSDDEPLINKAKRMRPNETSRDPDATPNSAQALASDVVEQPSNAQEHVTEKEQPVLSHEEEQITQNTSNQPDSPDNQPVARQQTNDLTEASNEQQKDYYPNEVLNEAIFGESDEEMAEVSEPKAPEPVPTNLLLSGGAYNAHNILLNQHYRPDSEGSQDEDCILGV